MPLSGYFHGGGEKVMENMTKEYGPTRGKSIFYATANARHAKPMQDGGIVDPELDEYGNPINPQGPPPPPPPISRPPMRRFAPDEGPPQPPEQGPPPPPMMQQGPPTPPMASDGPPPMPQGSAPPPPPQMAIGSATPPEMEMGPPPPPQTRIGQDPMQQRYRQAQEQTWNKAQEKVPRWKTALAAGLSISPRTAGIGRAILHPPDKLEEAMPTLQAGAKYAEQEQQAQSGEELKHEQIKATQSWHEANVAQRLAAIKPATTPVDRYRQAKDIPGITDEQMMEFALNGKVKPLSEKPDAFASSPQGIYSKSTGKIETPAPDKPDPLARENPNAWQADALSPDPAISGPAKAKLKADEDRRARISKSGAQGRVDVQVNAGGLNADDYTRAGEQYGRTGIMPPMGRDSATRARIEHAKNQWARDSGFKPADLMVIQAAYRGDTKSLEKFQAQRDQIVSFENTAKKNLDLFLTEAARLPDTGAPWANTPIRLLDEKLLGAKYIPAINAARQVANNEIAKVTSGGGLSGVLSDSARHEVRDYNPKDATFAQIMEVARVLKQDMANRHSSMDGTLADISARIGGSNVGTPPPQQQGGASGVPQVGGMFNGQRITNVKKIQ